MQCWKIGKDTITLDKSGTVVNFKIVTKNGVEGLHFEYPYVYISRDDRFIDSFEIYNKDDLYTIVAIGDYLELASYNLMTQIVDTLWNAIEESRKDKLMSAESVELTLYITNDGNLYNSMTRAIIKNLAKKVVKGTYDDSKAVKAWYNLATYGAQKYHKAYCDSASRWYTVFPVSVRKECAMALKEEYEETLAWEVERMRKEGK